MKLYYNNTRHNRCGNFEIQLKNSSIPKWTTLSQTAGHLELLRLITLSIISPGEGSLQPDLPVERMQDVKDLPIHLDFTIFSHHKTQENHILRYQSDWNGSKVIKDKKNPIQEGCRAEQCLVKRLTKNGCFRKIKPSNSLASHFMVAYGPSFTAHAGTDCFDFTNQNYFTNRFHTLFHPFKKITDPAAFLELLHYRGIKYKKRGSLSIITTLCRLLKVHLKIDSKAIVSPSADLIKFWRLLTDPQQKMILPLLDICRYFYDAFPMAPDPLEMPGVIILQRPDLFCPAKWFSAWIELVDSLAPNAQFMVSLSESSLGQFPATLGKKRLGLNIKKTSAPKSQKTKRLPGKSILLIDVDGKLPNLALMKLSRYYKEKGRNVVLGKKLVYMTGADEVFASVIFNSKVSMARILALKKYYGPNMKVGGSGVDLNLRLPEEIEQMRPDFQLYPELQDRAIGFITRGCPHKCSFCLVPKKEGLPRKVSDLSFLLGEKRKKLILLDDNLMAHGDATAILEEMVSMDLQVNFTQTLDLRHINREKADLLRKIHCMNTRFTRPNYYFSLNNNKRFPMIKSKYKMLGFTSRDNVEFIGMYGYNTNLAQDVERFRFLRSLPGAYVFVQQYQPVITGLSPHNESSFFDDNADELIDELISIVFTQNMKSMEKYYKWVSRKYALTYGGLHNGLVDTIFRYNNRHLKGRYIATLAGTRRG